MSNYTTLMFEIRDNVGRITLNRPEAGNVLNLQMAQELMEATLKCDESPEVRAVLLSGVGKNFCLGGDLKSFAAHGDKMAYHLKEVTGYFHTAIARLTRSKAPVVVAVQGATAGGGLSLACACDLVLAAESARFTVAYTKIGLTPDGSGSYFLPRLVGLKRALELTLTNRMFSAHEAAHWGIVTRVIPDAELAGQADALAVQLASGPTMAFATAKRLLHSGWTEPLETQMELEARGIADMGRTTDAREGITAFLEKRQPAYKGQ
ncbi:MAG: enoyl-CoA hydratase [Candidatus Binataceae bacterium]